MASVDPATDAVNVPSITPPTGRRVMITKLNGASAALPPVQLGVGVAESRGLSLVPQVVVRDEIQSRKLVEKHRVADVTETFFAVTPGGRFRNPLIRELVEEHSKKR